MKNKSHLRKNEYTLKMTLYLRFLKVNTGRKEKENVYKKRVKTNLKKGE